MRARLEALARDKRSLLERSALSRLHLGYRSRDVRAALHWKRISAEAVPPIGRAGVEIAVMALGIGRVARFVAFAGRMVLYARIVRSVIGIVRGRMT